MELFDCNGLCVYSKEPKETQYTFGSDLEETDKFELQKSHTLTANSVNLNIDLLNELLKPVGDFSIMLYFPEVVQVRKHRKKRINKKWAKKYGYKTILRKRPFTAPLEPDWFMPMVQRKEKQ